MTVSLVLTKLEYGNAMLSGLLLHLLRRLQSFENAVAQSIAGQRLSDAGLHCLHAGKATTACVAEMPTAASMAVHPIDLWRLSDVPLRHRLRSSATEASDVP